MAAPKGNQYGKGNKSSLGRKNAAHKFHAKCGGHDPLCRRGPHDDVKKNDWCQCPEMRRLSG